MKDLKSKTATFAIGVLLSAWCVQCGTSEQPLEEGPKPTLATIQRAYTMKCSLCHGADGKLMASRAPDLSKSEMNLDERIAIIRYGKGTMPPHNGVLDIQTIRGIAEYIETFK